MSSRRYSDFLTAGSDLPQEVLIMGTALRLETFGRLHAVTSDGVAITAPRRLALLALLAVAGERGMSRDKAVAYLWPESAPDRARHALEQLLYALRRETRCELFVDGNALQLDPRVVSSDLQQFEIALASGEIDQATELYAGPFVDGFFLGEAPEFERWAESERSRLATRYAQALEQIAQSAAARGDVLAAAERLRRLADVLPYDSRVALKLMEALATAGNPAGALLHAQSHESLLRRDLGAAPDPSITAFAEELRATHREAAGTRSHSQIRPAPPIAPISLGPRASPGLARRMDAHWRRGALAGALVLAGLLTLRAIGIRFPVAHSGTVKHGERERVVMADVRVSGPDSLIGPVVSDAVRADLDQSSAVTAVSPASVSAVLKRMGRSSGPVDLATAREIAMREGLKAIVDGEIAPLAAGFVVTLRVLDPATETVIASFTGTAETPRELIPMIDKLTRRLRGKMGESLHDVRASPPLEEVTTSSLEALRNYTAAYRAADRGEFLLSVRLLQQAIEFDTAFAMAYRKLAFSWQHAELGYPGMAHALTQAFNHRDRLSTRERYLTTADYARLVAGDRQKAADAFESVREQFPEERIAISNFAFLLSTRREFARAEALIQPLIEQHREDIQDHVLIVGYRVNQGKLAAAESSIAVGQQRFPAARYLDGLKAPIFVNRGELDSAEVVLRRARQSSDVGARMRVLDGLAALSLIRGRLREWERIQEDKVAGNPGRDTPTFVFANAILNARTDIWVRDNQSSAVERMDQVVRALGDTNALRRTENQYLIAAMVYAAAARPDRARRMIQRFNAYADSGFVRMWRYFVDIAEGEIALAEKRPFDAIVKFRAADRDPDGPSSDCTICLYAQLGRAFDQARMPDSTIAMFERYISTPFYARLNQDMWFLPRIYLRLAQLYEAKRDSARATSYYTKFLDLRPDADSIFQPQLRSAQQHLAMLSAPAKVPASLLPR